MVSVSKTQKQGGDCHGASTVDLILTFKNEPKEWLDSQTMPAGPCSIVARPLDSGEFELRFSYLSKKKKGQMEFLPFISTQRFVVDHWIAQAPSKKSATPKAQASLNTQVVPLETKPAINNRDGGSTKLDASTLADNFEGAGSWEKILGSAAVTLDFNSLEMDRFRQKNVERNVGIPKETIERLPLTLPLLDLPPMDSRLSFTEAKVEFTKFELPRPESTGKKEEHAVAAVEDGMNFVEILAQKGEWLKAQHALDILERSPKSAYLPKHDAKWVALKGLIYLRIGQQLKDKDVLKKALDIWRDGLRNADGWGGESQEFLEYMALEEVRTLFDQNLVYAAASILSWTRRYSWSAATEERFSFLRGEALYQLGLFDEARAAFDDFVNSRKEIPANSFADRRLVPVAAYRLGDLELLSGNYERAVRRYTQAFVEGPKSGKFSFESNWISEDVKYFPYVLFNRAEAYLRLGQDENALKDLRAFLFIAPGDSRAGVVYYRIGDILDSLGAPEQRVLGAWRECIFKTPNSLGGRLCQARKAAKEMAKLDKSRWPRLIADIEDAMKPKNNDPSDNLDPEELQGYLNMLLADVYIRLNEPFQALMRLDPLQALELPPYLAAWFHEYLVTSVAGYDARLVRENKFREVITDYEKRQKTLFLHQARHDVLWNLVKSYQGLDLLDEAMGTLETAEHVRDKIARTIPRPFEPSIQDWLTMRAALETELLAERKAGVDPARVRLSLEKIDAAKPENQKLWIRFEQIVGNLGEEAKWWGKLDQTQGLNWPGLARYVETLDDLKLEGPKKDILERRVGSWFGEKEKFSEKDAPPIDLVMGLFEQRANSGQKERALVVADYLTTLPSEKFNDVVTKPMVSYKKGRLLQELGRAADARQSFESAKQLAPDSIWGKLSASAQKEMSTGVPRSGSR